MTDTIWQAPNRYVPELLPWIRAHGLDPNKIKKGSAFITDDGTTKLLRVTEYLDEAGQRRADPITGEVPTRSVVVPLKQDPPVPSA